MKKDLTAWENNTFWLVELDRPFCVCREEDLQIVLKPDHFMKICFTKVKVFGKKGFS